MQVTGGAVQCAVCNLTSVTQDHDGSSLQGSTNSADKILWCCAPCGDSTLLPLYQKLERLQDENNRMRKQCERGLMMTKSLSSNHTKGLTTLEEMKQLQVSIMRKRLNIISDRIKLHKLRNRVISRQNELDARQKSLQANRVAQSKAEKILIGGLGSYSHWLQKRMVHLRQERVHQIFDIMKLRATLPPNAIDRYYYHRLGYISTIGQIPLPDLVRCEGAPPEVLAAALGRIVQLLLVLKRYIYAPIPYPVSLCGSFSTIDCRKRDGAESQLLYPDESLGFRKGLDMLQDNVVFICVAQGMDKESLLPKEHMIGNLIQMGQYTHLGEQLNHRSHTVQTIRTILQSYRF